jgi:D-alanine--poly(phosphoribitol) ligase subunit 1
MPGVTVRIADEAGVAQPTGAAGEVIIEGENVSAGYLGRPDLTAKVFTKRGGVRSYRTGDWGWLDESGLLFVSGRMDGQIKLSGYRVELGDIEANLRELPNVRDAVVLPVLKDGAASMLAAFVVPATARNGNSDLELMLALRGALSERLPVYMIPKKFVFLESFPMTPNGKADRRQLAATL